MGVDNVDKSERGIFFDTLPLSVTRRRKWL